MSCTSVNHQTLRIEVESVLHLFIDKALDTLASRASLSVTSSLSNEANTNLIAHNNDRLPLRTSSLSEETNTNLIAHNNSGYSLRSFQREIYFAKGPFPPCSLRYFRERSIILSISSSSSRLSSSCFFSLKSSILLSQTSMMS